jgi:tetratricopeptide (TPR) repeat protein
VSVLLVVALSVAPGGAQSPGEGGTDIDRGARLARGIRLFTENEFAEGLELLREARARDPHWPPASAALGSALVRAGRPDEARHIYEDLLGPGTAEALAEGTLTAADLPESTDPDFVLGLGMTYELAGKTDEAERLFRTAADLVGPAEAEASRAYRRLALLFESESVPWGDADAESLKAAAVDPDGSSGPALPAFPAPSSVPELEPYFRRIERSSERPDTLLPFDDAPWLMSWPGPAGGGAGGRSVRVEVLVDSSGVVLESTPLEATLADSAASVLTSQIARWRFAPARLKGRPTASWVVVPARAPSEAAREPEATPRPEPDGDE